jgi:D-galactarolactone cycloisomerase
MKIKRTQSQIVKLPAEEPLADGPGFDRQLAFVTLKLETDDGIEGIGVTFFGWALTPTLKHSVEQLAELALGEDPLRVEAVGRKIRSAAGGAGPGGIAALAFSAIDMALWDIKGKALGQPLAVLLGGLRDRVPTYASGALSRAAPYEHVVKAGPLLVETGFKQMKMQLALPGETTPAREVERARLIREAVGPAIDLMCDINQRWTSTKRSISAGASRMFTCTGLKT